MRWVGSNGHVSFSNTPSRLEMQSVHPGLWTQGLWGTEPLVCSQMKGLRSIILRLDRGLGWMGWILVQNHSAYTSWAIRS